LSTVILDTHVFAWGLDNYRRVNRVASERIQAADTVWVSPISFYEIGQKVRLGKWSESLWTVCRCSPRLRAEDGAIAILAAKLDWSHRDPFDRLIAATAMQLKAALISSDAAFDALSMQTDWPGRLW
jgi:PIN domain nuclease of toxin-antitoxin system